MPSPPRWPTPRPGAPGCSGTSHIQVRTPLTALDGYVEALIDGVFPANPVVVGALSDELRRLHRLANDLPSLSRMQDQGLDLPPVDADLADLARSNAARLAPQLQDAQATLIVNAHPVLPVRIDPDRITQMMTNLLGHALLATPRAGPSRSPRVPTPPVASSW